MALSFRVCLLVGLGHITLLDIIIRKYILFFITSMMFLTLLGLGTWQVSRLHEKEELLQTLAERAASTPQIPSSSVEEFSPVKLSGHFLPHTFALLSKTYKGVAGYHLLSPFVLDTGDTLLINRGWTPLKDKIAPPTGHQEFQGILRTPRRNAFQPDNTSNAWFTIDPPAMGGEISHHLLAFYAISATNFGQENLFVIPAIPHHPNNHLQYAITWYSFALILCIIFILLLRRERHKET